MEPGAIRGPRPNGPKPIDILREAVEVAGVRGGDKHGRRHRNLPEGFPDGGLELLIGVRLQVRHERGLSSAIKPLDLDGRVLDGRLYVLHHRLHVVVRMHPKVENSLGVGRKHVRFDARIEDGGGNGRPHRRVGMRKVREARLDHRPKEPQIGQAHPIDERKLCGNRLEGSLEQVAEAARHWILFEFVNGTRQLSNRRLARRHRRMSAFPGHLELQREASLFCHPNHGEG